MHYLQVGPFYCQRVIKAALNVVLCMIFLVGGKGCLQEMFGAVLLFSAEIVTVFLCAMEKKKQKQNDKIIIRKM